MIENKGLSPEDVIEAKVVAEFILSKATPEQRKEILSGFCRYCMDYTGDKYVCFCECDL